MKRAISIIIALLAILFALSACGGAQSSYQSSDQTTSSSSSSQNQSGSPLDVRGNYSGTYSFGSDSGYMSLKIDTQNGSAFLGEVELDLPSGSAICYSTNVNTVDGSTSVDQNGNISFEAYCGPDNPYLFFNGNKQGSGWQGHFHDKNNNIGDWNVT
jgi:hypothetical protein